MYIIGSASKYGQDLETGCPKLTIMKFLCVLFLKEDHNLRLKLQSFINVYFLNVKRVICNINIQCHGNYISS